MPQLPFLIVHGALVWKLVLAGLAAAAGALALRRSGDLRRATAGAVLAFAVGYAMLYELGQHLEIRDVAVDDAAALDELSIAAALPGTRARALRALHRGTERALTHDDAGLRRGLLLDAFVGNCAAPRLWGAGLLDEALTSARACAPELVTRILIELGRYEDAADAVDLYRRPREAMVAYLGAGRWTAAAETMTWLAASAPNRVGAGCFARYLAIKVGDLRALDALLAEPSEMCKVIAGLATGELPDAAAADTSDAAQLARELAASGSLDDLAGSGITQPAIWLADSSLVDRAEPARVERQRDLDAARDIITGKFVAASEKLHDPVDARIPDLDNWTYQRRALLVLLAVRSGGSLPSRDDDGTGSLEHLRRGVAEYLMAEWSPQMAGAPFESVTAAMRGDGEPLATMLRTCDRHWDRFLAPLLPEVLPHVVTHTAELREALRYYRNDSAYATGWGPASMITEDALYRDTALRISDVAEADRWQQIIERQAKTLSDRDRVIAFAIWDHLHMQS